MLRKQKRNKLSTTTKKNYYYIAIIGVFCFGDKNMVIINNRIAHYKTHSSSKSRKKEERGTKVLEK